MTAADPGVDRLNGVRAADDLADLDVKVEERHELGPGVLPEPHDGRVAGAPGLAELQEAFQRSALGRRGVTVSSSDRVLAIEHDYSDLLQV